MMDFISNIMTFDMRNKFMLQLVLMVAVGLYVNEIQDDQTGAAMEQYTRYFSTEKVGAWIKDYLTGERSESQAAIKFAFSIFLLLYIWTAPKKPKIVTSETLFHKQLLEHPGCSILHRKFWPTMWCPASYLQHYAYYALGSFRRLYQAPDTVYMREMLRATDGTLFSLDMYKSKKVEKDAPVVLITTPNVMGSHSYEVITAAEGLNRIGFRVFVLNQRGSAMTELTSDEKVVPTLNTISGYSDLQSALDFIRDEFEGCSVNLMTFGTTSVMALRYLNDKRRKAPVESLTCISPALALGGLAKPGWFANWMQLDTLKKGFLEQHAEVLKRSAANVNAARKARTVAEFHECITMRVCGDDPDDDMTYADYLGAHSMTSLGENIERPVLFLVSQNDPVQKCKEVLPHSVLQQIKNEHEHVVVAAVKHAGHGCFLEGLTASNWAPRVAGQFAISVMELNKLNRKRRAAAAKR